MLQMQPSSHDVKPMRQFQINGVRLSLPEGLATPAIAAKLADGSYEADEARAAGKAYEAAFPGGTFWVRPGRDLRAASAKP